MTQPFIIHHIEGRRSERVAWLCEELGLPYELRFARGDVIGSLMAIEPVHTMRMAPVFEDGDLKIVESGAILEYILSRYGQGRLRPTEDSPEFPVYLQWMHFAEGSAMPRGQIERIMIMMGPEHAPELFRGVTIGASKRVLDFCEAQLNKTTWFAGDAFTAADIMMHFAVRMCALATVGEYNITPLFEFDRRGLDAYPKLNGFLDRIEAMPSFQRAMQATMPDGPPNT